MVATDRPLLQRWVELLPARFEENLEQLNSLDARAGDGDHGVTMLRAIRAAADANQSASGTPDTVLAAVGTAFRKAAGGAAGPLFSSIFTELGRSGGPGELNAGSLAEGLRGAATAVARLGRVGPGERTMLDALMPAAEAAARQESLRAALEAAARAADEGALATASMRATKGRARYVNDGQPGVEDAGARSVAILLGALRDAGG